MVEDAVDPDIEQLFNQAAPFADEAGFGDAVNARIERLRRTSRLVHGLAWLVGGTIAVLQLSQPSFWAWLGGSTEHAGAALDGAVDHIATAWFAPTPMFCAAVLGAALLVAYLTNILREN